MKTLLALLCAVSLVLGTGCVPVRNGTASNLSERARTFQSLDDCWSVTYTAYFAFKVAEADGKVKADDARVVDTAWNVFRLSWDAAAAAASNGQTTYTPENVRRLANDVLDLIAAAL